MLCGLAALLAAGLLVSPASGQLSATQKADIGFTALQARLGAAMPLGGGVSATQVEAAEGTNYRVNTSDAQLTGKTFVFASGSTGASGHATDVAKYMYGSQSLAPRIGATADGATIANYSAIDWLQGGFLRYGTPSQLPAVETRTLVNHSWIGSTGNAAADAELLNRADFAVQRDGSIATYAVNNGSGSPIPSLLASTYNGIVVGLSNGNHSRGTTTVNGSGRSKPDIVVPSPLTSYATPTVASAAGLLAGVAQATAGLADGGRPQVVKSLLMAGADKEGSNLPDTWSWSQTSTRPLDSIYGAGQLNIERSYDVLVAGEFMASGTTLAVSTGWDFGRSSNSAPQQYFFEILPGQAGADLTASLNWQRTMLAVDLDSSPEGTNYVFGGALANLDLRLYAASGFSVGALLAESVGTVDNTELIWARNLPVGRYALEVSSSNSGIDYGVAWVTAVPEPGTWILASVAGVLLLATRMRRAGLKQVRAR